MDMKFNLKKNKSSKLLDKKGINLLGIREDRMRSVKFILFVTAALIALIIVLKFGFIDVYSKLYAAQADYQDVHLQYETMNARLADFDNVQLEYRTYYKDWLYEDESGKFVSVPRTKVLDLLESEVMSSGTLDDYMVSGDVVLVDIHDMTLSDISKMCERIEESPFVSKAMLVSAETQETEEDKTEETETDGTTQTEETVRKSPEDGGLLNARISIQLMREAEGEEE